MLVLGTCILNVVKRGPCGESVSARYYKLNHVVSLCQDLKLQLESQFILQFLNNMGFPGNCSFHYFYFRLIKIGYLMLILS